MLKITFWIVALIVSGIVFFFVWRKFNSSQESKTWPRAIVLCLSVILIGASILRIEYNWNNLLSEPISEALSDYQLELVSYEKNNDGYIQVYCYDEQAFYYRYVYLLEDEDDSYTVYVYSNDEYVELYSLMWGDGEEIEEE